MTPPNIRNVIALITLAAVLGPLATGLARAQRLPPHQRPGRILGTVVQLESGAPAVGASVALRGTVLSTIVLPDGSFQILDVPSGVYEVSVSGRLYRTVLLEDVKLLPGDSAVLNIALRRHPLMGEQRVVTPARRAQPEYEISQSLSILRRDAPSFAAGVQLDRVLAITPGVHLNGRQLSIRASSSGLVPYGSRVALMVDGLPLTTPDLGSTCLTAVPLIAVDQIEVLRGSASMLYGSGAIAGAVNLLTHRPLEANRATAQLSTGVYTDAGDAAPAWWGDSPRRFRAIAGAWSRRQGRFNFLLAGGLRADAGYRQRDERDGYDVVGRFNMTLDRGAELRLAGIRSYDERGAPAFWRGADSALFSPVDSGSTSQSASFTGLAIEYRGVDSRSLAFQLRGILQNAGSTLLLRDSVQESSGTRLGAEVQLTSFLNRRISLTYGGIGQIEFASAMREREEPWVRRVAGAWGQIEFTNLYDIVATFGTRIDLVSRQRGSDANTLQVTPQVGVAYHPIPSTSIRLTIGRGYRDPSLAELGLVSSAYGVPVAANPDLRSEQSWQGEISGGYRDVFGEISAGAELALFVNEYFSMIEPDVDGSGQRLIFLNSTRARILGFELQGEAAYRGRFAAEFSLSGLAARDLTRRRTLQGRPSLLATASLSWHPEPVTARLLFRAAGRIETVDAGTLLLVPDAARSEASQAFDLVVDVDLEKATDVPIAGYLAIRNMFGSLATDGIGAVAPIRSVEAGVRAEF